MEYGATVGPSVWRSRRRSGGAAVGLAERLTKKTQSVCTLVGKVRFSVRQCGPKRPFDPQEPRRRWSAVFNLSIFVGEVYLYRYLRNEENGYGTDFTLCGRWGSR